MLKPIVHEKVKIPQLYDLKLCIMVLKVVNDTILKFTIMRRYWNASTRYVYSLTLTLIPLRCTGILQSASQKQSFRQTMWWCLVSGVAAPSSRPSSSYRWTCRVASLSTTGGWTWNRWSRLWPCRPVPLELIVIAQRDVRIAMTAAMVRRFRRRKILYDYVLYSWLVTLNLIYI